MGWFDEQIRQRKEDDRELFEASLMHMASSVLGSREGMRLADERVITKEAIDGILRYYGKKPAEIPDDMENLEDQLEYALRPHGLMRRSVVLEGKWYQDACGPMIAFHREDGRPEALLPRSVGGYYYRVEGTRRRVSRKEAEGFERRAVCFYRPLPRKELGIRDLLQYLKECISAGDAVWLIALTLAISGVGILLTKLSAFLSGYVLQTGQVNLLVGTAIFLFSALAASQLFSMARSLSMSRIGTKASVSVEAAVMMRLITLPMPFFRKYSSGELASRTSAVNSLCSLLLGNVVSIAMTSLSSLMYVGQIFRYAPGLVIPALAMVALNIIVMVVTAAMQMGISRKQMEYGAKESGISLALIGGIQKIRLAGAEKRAFAKWGEAYAKTAEVTYDLPLFLRISGTVSLAISLLGTLIMYSMAVATAVAPSDYYAFNIAYGMVSGAFMSLAQVAVSISKIKPILEMTEPILKTCPEEEDGKEIVREVRGDIELNHVSFRYDEHMPYVLDDLSLHIRAGEYVAVVGKTGCGKSTLMRLLLGFETPERGAVYYDGKDLKALDLRSLRQKIGTVTQEGGLFQGDILSNILISAPHLKASDAWAAAEAAGIADDIRAMPMGMQTMISEGSGGISGGQRQRLMIARAIAPRPRVLFFDEATSALDNLTQKKVSDSLDALSCTRVIIAHRLSTIRNCDRIIVLADGQIREEGTYEELIAKNGYFAELVKRQRIGEED